MSLFRGRLLLLGAAAALLLARCFGSSSHSLLYLQTAISERGRGSPQFSALAYMDDQLLGRYDRDTRQCLPQSSWMEEIAHDSTLLWDRSSGRKSEVQFTADLGVFKNLYNRSQRLHVLQVVIRCELTKDDHARGFMKYGYNERDFLSLDQKTLTWTALEAEAKLIKQKWDAEPSRGEYWKHFVQETCVDWLRAHLHYGKAALLRNEPPMVNVMRKAGPDGLEILLCRAHGFYPKEIEVTWTKDGVDHMQDTLTGGVVPNLDETYHKWLSIEVDPKDRDRFRCHVEHDGLREPLDVAWEEPGSLGLILGVLLGVLVAAAVLLGVGVAIYMKKCRGGYKEASTSEQESDSNAGGVHVLQAMYGCEVGPDGRPTAGYMQYGYDGEDFFSFDKETLTWTARVPQALASKRKWEVEKTIAQGWKTYLEEECVEWVQRYLRYGKETLQRTMPPTVNVTRKKHQDGQETLVCRAHGFHPKDIKVTWMKDGVDQMQDTFTWEVVPNSDGTYHKWLSIEVDPKDRDRYRCHVGHDSLEKPLDLAWEEPVSSVSVGLIVRVLVGVLLAAAALVVGVVIYYIQKHNRPLGGYKATRGSEQGSDTSVQAPSAVA